MASGPLPRGKFQKLKDTRVNLLALAAGAAYILQATPGWPVWAKWPALGVGAALTVITVTVNVWDNKRRAKRFADAEELAKQARLGAIESTRTAIEPGLDALARIAAEKNRTERRRMAGRMQQLITDIACEMHACARASYYSYDDTGSSGVLRWEQVWRKGRNRQQAPRPAFEEGDKGAGDEVFKLMESGNTKLVKDVSQLPEDERRPDRDYETWIVAPVVLNEKKFGFLGVDAPDPEILSDEDENMMRILALILAVGLALAD